MTRASGKKNAHTVLSLTAIKLYNSSSSVHAILRNWVPTWKSNNDLELSKQTFIWANLKHFVIFPKVYGARRRLIKLCTLVRVCPGLVRRSNLKTQIQWQEIFCCTYSYSVDSLIKSKSPHWKWKKYLYRHQPCNDGFCAHYLGSNPCRGHKWDL